MRILRVLLLCGAALVVGVLLVSGGSGADPRTPPALPGLPPPFLGTAVTGDGGLTAAIDSYGDVVDLRAGPAGAPLIDNPSDRQAAGTVPTKTGIVPRMSVGGSPPLPIWRGERVTQHYRRDSNLLETVAYIREARLITLTVATGDALVIEMIGGAGRQGRGVPAISVDIQGNIRCAHAKHGNVLDLLCRTSGPLPTVEEDGNSRALFRECDRIVHDADTGTHEWLARSTPLGEAGGGRRFAPGGKVLLDRGAPRWARAMYRRSLLTIHALTSRATGAVAAGARDGWAYVWPRDAATAALALAASGHRSEARKVAKFLTGLDLTAAARFKETGDPVPDRAAQGDAAGWVAAAAEATGLHPPPGLPWRDRADYQESTPGTYLANALAAAASQVDGPRTPDIEVFSARQHRTAARIAEEFGTTRGLVRRAGDPASGLDSAAAWAIRPFSLRPLYPDAEASLLRLAKDGTRFGITPGEGWNGGNDPWSAPTAWSAWSLAALANETEAARTDRRAPRTNLPAVRERGITSGRSRRPRQESLRLRQASLHLLADLRRASTPAGDLAERVDVHTGIPTSTTPLLWSSAFTVLALRELWPERRDYGTRQRNSALR